MFLLCDSDGRTDVFDVLEHENRVLLCVFEFLEEKKRLFVVAETSLYAISCKPNKTFSCVKAVLLTGGTVTYEHGIILPMIVVDLVLLKGGGKHFPRWVL